MTLAIFDLDNTILRGDSDSAWFKFLLDNNQVPGIPDEEFTKLNKKFYDDYAAGRLIFEEYAEFAFGILKSIHITKLKEMRKDYFRSVIKPMIYQKAEEKIASHKNKGDRVIISTATNEFVTTPIAAYLRVDDLIATKLEKNAGGFSGNYYGTPNFREGKLTNIREWLKDHPEHQLATSYFYTDSINDLPLLEVVGYPRPVNVDEELAKVCKTRKWRISSFA